MKKQFSKSLEQRLRKLPGDAPRFVDPMLCRLVNHLPGGSDWIYEIKLDGYRAQAIKDKNLVQLISRNQKNIGGLGPRILDVMAKLPVEKIVLDGEIVSLDPNGIPNFELLQNRKTIDAPTYYYAFDLLHFEGKNLASVPLVERKEMLKELLLGDWDPIRFLPHFNNGLDVLVEEASKLQLEGIIAKKAHSRYESGKRTGTWIKFKLEKKEEFLIGGFKRGGKSGLEMLLVGQRDRNKFIHVAKIRAGLTPHLRKQLLNTLEKRIIQKCPFTNLPENRKGRWNEGITAEEMKEYVWVKPELRCEVDFVEWTSEHHLRHPRFVTLK